MRRITLIALMFGLGMLLLAAGCGGATSHTTSVVEPSSSPPTNTTTPPPTPQPVYITVTPYSSPLGATQSQRFVAKVSNTATTAVDWSISDCTGDCGIITSDGLYTAPSFVAKSTSVTIRATLHADTSIVGFGWVSLQPVSLTITPAAPARLAPNAVRPFNAIVHYDPANRGVTWSLSGIGCAGDTCGTLTDVTATSVVYHAPAGAPNPPAVLLKANAVTDGNQGAVAGIIVAASASQYKLQGTYAFLIHGKRWAPGDPYDYGNGGDAAMAGHVAIDGGGNVTGIWDANLKASGGVTELISGSYAVEEDGNGTLTLQAASGTWTFAIAVQAGGDSAALSFDRENPLPNSTTVQSGCMVRQDPDAFSMGSVAGDRVLALTFMNVGAIGRITASSDGAVSNGMMDLTWAGGYLHFFTTSTVTGSFRAPDPLSGRGTAALTVVPGPDTGTETFHFAYYIVSDKKMLLVETDANTWQLPVLRGEARYQTGAGTFSNASLNAPVLFSISSDDAGMWWTPAATLGVIRPDGAGSFTEIWDENQQLLDIQDFASTKITLQATDSGIYSITTNGRLQLALRGLANVGGTPQMSSYSGVAYLVDNNSGYIIRAAGFGTPFGYFEPFTPPPLHMTDLAGSYNTSMAGPPRTFKAEKDSGFITLRADGSAEAFLTFDMSSITPVLYPSVGFTVGTFYYTGTFTFSENGHGVISLSETANGETKIIPFWAMSANHLVAMLSMTMGDTTPIIVELRR